MDKQRNERISIRINGKERIFLSDEELNQEISAAKEINEDKIEVEFVNLDPIIIDDLLDDDGRDNVIDFEERRNGRRNSYYTELKGKKAHLLVAQKKKTLLKKKKRRPPTIVGNSQQASLLKRFAAVLLSAIIIGIGFGYIILSLFTDFSEEQNVEEVNAEITDEQAGLPNKMEDDGAKTTAGIDAGSTGESIAPLKVQVIQGGAFGSVESAKQFAGNLEESGAAAVILPESDPVLMFIGLGTDRSELENISQSYIEKGQEIYIKSFELSGIDSDKLKNQAEAEFISAGVDLFQALTKLSSQTFQTKDIEKNTWDEVETKFSQWSQLKPKELPVSLEQFSKSVTNAYQSLSSYQTKADEQKLWNSQQALLEGLISYKIWHDEK